MVDRPLHCVLGLIAGSVLEVDVMVAEMCREVYTEANTHDEVDQRDTVQDDVPDGHEAEAPGQGAHDAEDGGDGREDVRQEDDGDSDDDDASEENTLERLAEYCQILVRVGEIAVKYVGLEVLISVIVTNISDLHHHFLLIFGCVDILSLDEKPGGQYPADILVVGQVQSVLRAGVLIERVNLLDKLILRVPVLVAGVPDEGLSLVDGPEVMEPGLTEVLVDVV